MDEADKNKRKPEYYTQHPPLLRPWNERNRTERKKGRKKKKGRK
jgi:hypothetical protein